jgi:hypothetical protein
VVDYWRGESIEIDWERERALWDFFWKLCRKSKRGQACDSSDFGEDFPRAALSTRKWRLVNHDEFPPELKTLVEWKRNVGYRLDLDGRHIRLFRVAEGGRLEETRGGVTHSA